MWRWWGFPWWGLPWWGLGLGSRWFLWRRRWWW